MHRGGGGGETRVPRNSVSSQHHVKRRPVPTMTDRDGHRYKMRRMTSGETDLLRRMVMSSSNEPDNVETRYDEKCGRFVRRFVSSRRSNHNDDDAAATPDDDDAAASKDGNAPPSPPRVHKQRRRQQSGTSNVDTAAATPAPPNTQTPPSVGDSENDESRVRCTPPSHHVIVMPAAASTGAGDDKVVPAVYCECRRMLAVAANR